MSRGRTTLAIVAVTAVAVIAGCTQKTTPAAVTAGAARTATVIAYGASNVARYSPAQEMAQLVTT